MTMHFIQSISAPSGTAASFTSIPSTYTHLQLRMYVRSTANAATAIGSLQFNNDQSTTSYNGNGITADGATISNTTQGANTYITLPPMPANTATASIYGFQLIDILDYTSTTKSKTIKIASGFDANGSGNAFIGGALWYNTPAAIHTINFGITTGWASGTRFDLYGITNNPIATGA
jgi:hypothetical protein